MGNWSSKSKPTLESIKQRIDIPKFMGKWYVIGVKPTYFEIGATNAVEEYNWNEKSQTIDIMFTFNAGNVTGPLKKIPQKGYIYNKETNAEWRVSPMWPLKLPYLVIELGEDPSGLNEKPYHYTVIGYPSRDYVWIMARTPQIDDNLYKGILERLEREHFYNLEGLVKMKHSS